MSDDALLAAVRHNVWANLELLAFCASLSVEQRGWTVPGTYGSIHATLGHIVGAEHFYLFALTGARPPIEAEQGGRALSADRLAPLDELIERVRSNGERIERVLAEGFDPGRIVQRRRGGTATARVIVAQFVHHGSDHRAHIGTILGAHGLQPPDLDVWAWGSSLGQVTAPSPA